MQDRAELLPLHTPLPPGVHQQAMHGSYPMHSGPAPASLMRSPTNEPVYTLTNPRIGVNGLQTSPVALMSPVRHTSPLGTCHINHHSSGNVSNYSVTNV